MTRPLVLLDIDGVLAPTKNGRGGDFDDWTEHRFEAQTIFWTTANVTVALSAQMAGELLAVIDDAGAQAVWASTWCRDDQANELISPAIGWRRLDNAIEVGKKPRLSDSSDSWKLDGLIDYAFALRDAGEMPDKVVWIDDRLAYDTSWLVTEAFAGVDVACVRPDSRVGLDRDDIARIGAFLR